MTEDKKMSRDDNCLKAGMLDGVRVKGIERLSKGYNSKPAGGQVYEYRRIPHRP